MQYFEFVDRELDRDIVQCGMFTLISNMSQVKKGDKIIVPPSDKWAGCVDAKKMQPILLTVKSKNYIHIGTKYGSYAFDLCYKLIED